MNPTDHELEVFCRLYGLNFVEFGTRAGRGVLWFKDLENRRVCYSPEEIRKSIQKRRKP